jgi:TetR/AcrR family transcriptional repressor of lmrAB and yxaGH operons
MKAIDTRSRLVAAMTEALRSRGLHGVGLSELLERAEAPKGVLYHHFPGGKTELAIAAIEASAARICAALDAARAANQDPIVLIREWIADSQRRLGASGFERGCPLATVALESTRGDKAIRAALAEGFAAIRGRIAAALVAAGDDEEDARALAALIVAAYEGSLLQARVAGAAEPMTLAASALLTLIERHRRGKDDR